MEALRHYKVNLRPHILESARPPPAHRFPTLVVGLLRVCRRGPPPKNKNTLRTERLLQRAGPLISLTRRSLPLVHILHLDSLRGVDDGHHSDHLHVQVCCAHGGHPPRQWVAGEIGVPLLHRPHPRRVLHDARPRLHADILRPEPLEAGSRRPRIRSGHFLGRGSHVGGSARSQHGGVLRLRGGPMSPSS